MESVRDLKWFVLFTKPKHERVVNENLKKRGISTFLPEHYVMRQWSDRKRKLLMPLFPGYLFVKAHAVDYSIAKVSGVIRYLFFHGKPATVTEREISLIQRLLEHEPTETNDDYTIPGQRVKVVQGPFEGETGIFVRKEGQTRLYIELESLSKFVSVSLPAQYIVKI